MATPILRATLQVASGLVEETAAFYGGRLGLLLAAHDEEHVAVELGESVLELRAAAGRPFYHVALLVPGDRFDAALDWAQERVALLPESESGELVFDFAFWDALACYFHDPSGTIVELIAHRGVGETGADGPFRAEELLGISEVGIVGDPPADAAALDSGLGIEVWDGTVEGERGLAFAGEQARTLILCRAGRPWLPTGRPAEPYPADVELAGKPVGSIELTSGSRVSRRGAGAAVRAF